MMRSTTMTMVGLLALGCGSVPPEPAEPLRVAAGDDLQALAPSRGRVRGGEKVRRRVEWPPAEARAVAAYEGLDARSRAAVDEAPVPVLVPGPDVALDQRTVMHGPEWAAFWGRREGVTVTVHASRMARVFPGVRPKPGSHTLRGQEAFMTRNEGIWAASWIEHGVAYSLEVECAPPDAPPCDDAATVEGLAEGLVYVGGRGEEVTP
ncbi:MAG: hypothetical protein KDK70_25225 [Myxococcales bacterium]|nr:hypothetical protein [Myxococcales bacterium]